MKLYILGAIVLIAVSYLLWTYGGLAAVFGGISLFAFGIMIGQSSKGKGK